MSHGNAIGGGGGADESEFDLPDEILAVMPTNPYEQLDLARKITSMAIASRVSRLDLEAVRLRKIVAEKDGTIAELQEKLAHADRMLQQADSRLQLALEENINLVKERDSLLENSNKLARDLAKLETFKRQLMQSLSEDNVSKQQDTVELKICDQSFARASLFKDEIFMSGPATLPKSTSTENTARDSIPKKSYVLSGSTPRVDGKEFFRQARSRLSYEQFGAFLANIKELNAHKQSREETLKKAEEIFGTDNKDLYISFQGLLKCNMR